MYLSIDFEDFNHDLKRGLGLWKTGPLKSDALWKKYNLINDFFRKSNNNSGSCGTFFCTGVIAEKEPDLIKKISDDGHEIACHYYYHDLMKNDNEMIIERNLRKAKELLEDASGKKVMGFRAPFFAIEKNFGNQYKIVEKIFIYDSSFFCSNLDEINLLKMRLGLEKLKIIPIFQTNFANFNFKLGGSYLKFLPNTYIDFMIRKSIKNGFEPHIYLHPYEFGNSNDFRITKKELQKLGIKKSIYWYLRQNQWISFRNESLPKKVDFLLKKNKLSGVLSQLAE